jgi:predicted GH43/DUF377 family glycosyl hydrolase
MNLQRYSENPILTPNQDNYWESLVTTNPAAWYDKEKKEFNLLYRAAGNNKEHTIYLGRAVSKNGYDFKRVSDKPTVRPQDEYTSGSGIEDPRVVKIKDYYYITYASRPFPPGQYWLNKQNPYKPQQCPEDFPRKLKENSTSTFLLITKDWKNFIDAGRLTSALLDDRDVILFPEKINGKYFMMHRPMEWTGEKYGTKNPAIWISQADDWLGFNNSTLLAKAKFEWEEKIGGNTPPIKTKHGWLTLYHAVGSDSHYRLGAMLLDLQDPTKVLYRSKDWILQPEKDYELNGFYNGCIFPCGKVVVDNKLYVYYGGADRYVGLATCSLTELIDYLLTCPQTNSD